MELRNERLSSVASLGQDASFFMVQTLKPDPLHVPGTYSCSPLLVHGGVFCLHVTESPTLNLTASKLNHQTDPDLLKIY